MTPMERKRALRLDLVLAGTMVAMGLTVAGLSLTSSRTRGSGIGVPVPSGRTTRTRTTLPCAASVSSSARLVRSLINRP